MEIKEFAVLKCKFYFHVYVNGRREYETPCADRVEGIVGLALASGVPVRRFECGDYDDRTVKPPPSLAMAERMAHERRVEAAREQERATADWHFQQYLRLSRGRESEPQVRSGLELV